MGITVPRREYEADPAQKPIPPYEQPDPATPAIPAPQEPARQPERDPVPA
jgi:hypothetical protein